MFRGGFNCLLLKINFRGGCDVKKAPVRVFHCLMSPKFLDVSDRRIEFFCNLPIRSIFVFLVALTKANCTLYSDWYLAEFFALG